MPYISFIIENQEPLKIGANGNKLNQKEPTKDYIPGNTLRGAIIYKIFRQVGEVSNLLLNQVKFYNAYLTENEKVFYPTPLHLRVDKHDWRKEKAKGNKNATIEINNLIDASGKGKNNLENRFVAVDGDRIIGKKVKKTYRLHNSLKRSKNQQEDSNVDSNGTNDLKKQQDQEEGSNLYRYEAIDVGHCFKGIIYVPDEATKKQVLDALAEKEIVIGGAKTTGYGKCTIGDTKEVAGNLELGERCHASDRLILTCLSDGLFRDAYGLPTSSLDPAYLEKYFGEVELEKQFVDTSVTEGYNVRWKARLPKETTLKAGSILVYRMKNPPSNIDETIRSFEAQLHGERQVEGYGWIGVNLYYPNTFYLGEDDNKVDGSIRENIEKNLSKRINGAKKDSNLGIIFSGIQEGRLDWIREYAYREIQNKDQEREKENSLVVSPKLNKNQAREMYEIIGSETLSQKHENYMKNRDHTKDNKVFSFYDCNFNELVDYCLRNGHAPNKKLVSYAEDKLSIKSIDKGFAAKLYFKNWENTSSDEENKRLFIKLLIQEILYLLLRKLEEREGSASNEE